MVLLKQEKHIKRNYISVAVTGQVYEHQGCDHGLLYWRHEETQISPGFKQLQPAGD